MNTIIDLGDSDQFLDVVTPWLMPPEGPIDEPHVPSDLDLLRDRVFRQRVLEVLHEDAPWLVPILKAAKAVVAAGPGIFTVALNDGAASQNVEIPALAQRLILLPWAEVDEAAH